MERFAKFTAQRFGALTAMTLSSVAMIFLLLVAGFCLAVGKTDSWVAVTGWVVLALAITNYIFVLHPLSCFIDRVLKAVGH